jgi:hypothetical protein
VRVRLRQRLAVGLPPNGHLTGNGRRRQDSARGGPPARRRIRKHPMPAGRGAAAENEERRAPAQLRQDVGSDAGEQQGRDVQVGRHRPGPPHGGAEHVLGGVRRCAHSIGDRDQPARVEGERPTERMRNDERHVSRRRLGGGPVDGIVRGSAMGPHHDRTLATVRGHLVPLEAVTGAEGTTPMTSPSGQAAAEVGPSSEGAGAGAVGVSDSP